MYLCGFLPRQVRHTGVNSDVVAFFFLPLFPSRLLSTQPTQSANQQMKKKKKKEKLVVGCWCERLEESSAMSKLRCEGLSECLFFSRRPRVSCKRTCSFFLFTVFSMHLLFSFCPGFVFRWKASLSFLLQSKSSFFNFFHASGAHPHKEQQQQKGTNHVRTMIFSVEPSALEKRKKKRKLFFFVFFSSMKLVFRFFFFSFARSPFNSLVFSPCFCR